MDSACATEDSDEDVSEESMLEDSDSSERKEDSVCDDSEAAVLVTEVAIVASASIDDIWSLLTLPAGGNARWVPATGACRSGSGLWGR